METKPNYVRATFWILPKQAELIRKAAKKTKTTQSEVMRSILAEIKG